MRGKICTVSSCQANPGRFSGQMACLGHIVRTEGPQGLLRGSLLTLVRDVPAFCAYFATYETLRSKFQKEDGTIDLGRTVAIGGLAGVIAWALALPLDSLKNRFQVCLNHYHHHHHHLRHHHYATRRASTRPPCWACWGSCGGTGG